MSVELARRDYLAANRRMIVGRAIASTLAGLVPVPIVDDWLVSTLLASGYRRIAAAHQVDIDRDAVTYLVHGPTQPASWGEMATTAVVFKIAARTWRRVLVAFTAARRARAASRTFVVMTIFDHYCARRHTGLALDPPTAKRVRAAISGAIEQTAGGLSFEPFRRGAASAARASLRAPLELADIVTGGRIRRLLEKNPEGVVAEPPTVSELDQAIDEALADKTGFLSRAATAVELNLTAEVNPYLDNVLATFDRLWAAGPVPTSPLTTDRSD